MSGRGADELRISGTAPGNRRPPWAQLSDGGSNGELRRDRPACGGHPAPARAGCTNKPNLARLHPAPTYKDAKQTQSGTASWRAGPPGGEECETNPIRSGRASGERECAKRTQFPATTGGSRRAGRGRGANRTNKPNLARLDAAPGYKTPNKPSPGRPHGRPALLGVKNAKQTQFAGGKGPGLGTGAAGPVVQTKPICPRGAEKTIAKSLP
jgi:hypothetical protein